MPDRMPGTRRCRLFRAADARLAASPPSASGLLGLFPDDCPRDARPLGYLWDGVSTTILAAHPDFPAAPEGERFPLYEAD